MLKKYKNKFVEVFEELNFPKGTYEITYSDNFEDENVNSTLIIQIKDTNLLFSLRNSKYSFHQFDVDYTEFSPDSPLINFPPSDWATFETCLNILKGWKKDHVDEYLYEKHQPDMLEILNREQFQQFHSIEFDDNIPFTSEERKQIIEGLEEIKLLIPDLGFTESQLAVITKRLDYLAEATERLDKIDWKEMLISSLIALIMTLALDTEKSQQLISLFSKVFSTLFRLEF